MSTDEFREGALPNPPTNCLPSGLSHADLVRAVSQSGFPLQTIVARMLRQSDARMGVTEEWSYLDPETQKARTIDILATLDLYDFVAEQQRVEPTLNALIECKQSEMPYLFFLTDEEPWIPNFPSVAGLVDQVITISTDDDTSTWSLDVLHAFELDRHPFMRAPAFAFSFSKSSRKGKKIELTGSDAYDGLMQPLLKAVQHYHVAEAPTDIAVYFRAHLVVAIAVLDAPMITVRVAEGEQRLAFEPWVRVVRRVTQEPHRLHSHHVFAIDVLHKDFVGTYLTRHLRPFAESFRDAVNRHQAELATCKAFASGMGANSRTGRESRLRPPRKRSRIAKPPMGRPRP